MLGNSSRTIKIVLAVVVLVCVVSVVLGFVFYQDNAAVESLTQQNAPITGITEIPNSSTTSTPLDMLGTQTPTPVPLGVQVGIPSVPQNQRVLIKNGDREIEKIALTFDVCQAEGDLSGYDTEIVRVLTDTQTPATFFLGGEWIRDHQENARELASNPLFQLGNHSWSHADFSSIGPQKMQQEIQLAQEMLFNLTGRPNNLFRLPYGYYNDDALNVIGENGLYIIQWDVVSGDPDPNIDAASMTDWVIQQVQPGSIIIMHANGRGWHTAEALPTIIQTLKEQGYTFVTISELINLPRP